MRPSVPINVMLNTRKPHRSNKEIEKRIKNEELLEAESDKVKAPDWLCKEGKKEFKKTVNELKKLKLVTNLDINSMAIYSDCVAKFADFESQIDDLKQLLNEANEIEDILERIKTQVQLNKMIINYSTKKLSLADNIRKYSVEFGLTPQSRAKLAIPKKEVKEIDEFDRQFGAV